ncbi:hypothetical protein NPIL_445941 [Nephila pilipes]|uniref:DUF5641 domain-containing protein n=1 Tax=Nephila pilipes TaxID=299642 RepID=A0A8X6P724_NEPPI|nr:hypothetical protein NPIL_445941 [Nephila pilipes]
MVRKESSIQEGGVDLISNNDIRRFNWTLAKFVMTYPGISGRVRVLEVNNKSGPFLQWILRLYTPEVFEDESSFKHFFQKWIVH